MKSEADMALLRRMAEQADVLISNLAPGAMERYGLTGDLLRKANPGLITCMLSGLWAVWQGGAKKSL